MTESAQPVKLNCPRCGHYLGATDGTYFESRPCPNCRWRLIAWRGDVWPERPKPQRFMQAVEIKG